MAKVYTGTVSIDETAGADVEVKAITITKRTRLLAIWIDGGNLADGSSAKVFVDLGSDGTVSTQIDDYDLALVAGESVNVLKDGPIVADTDVIVKLASDGGGGGSNDIYYRIPYEEIEVNEDLAQDTNDDIADLPSRVQMEAAFEKLHGKVGTGGNYAPTFE